ncbi:sugar kinase [Rhizomonospora bruguierae]|uniref:sugar kinase n=1 Tax=Rhizomonospora bruguierae TaxID=1581705 RepID=UPI0020BFF9AE|nr:sugar kinase [Micromonospora sp. NBRC 107566]
MSVDLLAIGETMASLRAASLLRLGGQLALSIAGAESNVAIGVARLGHSTRWVGRVGGDELGQLVLRTLRAERVDVEHVTVTPDALTGMLLFERGPGGATRVHYRRQGSAASRLAPHDIDTALRDGMRVLHVTGITPALGDAPAQAVRHAVEAARTAGATVCLDVNFRAKLWGPVAARRSLRPLLTHVDVLVASEDELPLVSDGSHEAARVEALLAGGIAEVVVKRGRHGASVYTIDGRIDRPAVPVPVVDTVGAGDAFTAGYLSGLLDGLDPADRIERAGTVAAAAVAALGDWEGLPTRSELGHIGHASQEAIR